jgi:DNA-binding transcriptional ArsR family regulator
MLAARMPNLRTPNPGRTSMATDLLSAIRHEIDERMRELRPLIAEYERLLVAAGALVATGREVGSVTVAETAAPPKRERRGAQARVTRRGSAAGAIQRAATGPAETTGDEQVDKKSAGKLKAVDAQPAPTPRRSATAPKPERAARGAAREAILAALDHGSHTVSELAVVTAMSGPNINGNLRRLFSEGAVVKTEREGKAAWALPDTPA